MPEKRERQESIDDEMEAEFTDVQPVSGAAETEDNVQDTPELGDVTEKKEAQKQNQAFSQELLTQYYRRLFPYQLLHCWLTYDPSQEFNKKTSSTTTNNKKQIASKKNKVFSHREFSFTTEIGGEEIYMRYKSFSNQNELTSAVQKINPRKIDIGAVFSHPPKDHHAIQGSSQRKLAPSQRELVFDVDLTDYDEVRKCGCSGAKICLKCWKMMGMAMKVMDEGLREDFGFKNIAWFYSGRRGIHAWVCDENARELSDSGRSAVANYFEVNLGTEKNQNVELNSPLHPMLLRAFKTLEPMFIKDIIPSTGHGILADEDKWNELLQSIPQAASSVATTLASRWTKEGAMTTPREKWLELKRYLEVFIGKDKSKSKQSKNSSAAEKSKIELWPIATVFKYTYPRLDINVSKMRNHLLKSPFCVHPKTGRVCIPINANKMDEFDPFEDVPTLPQLMKELDMYAESGGKDVEFEWEKTSLKESFQYFQKEFLAPMWKDLKRNEKDEVERNAAMVGDF